MMLWYNQSISFVDTNKLNEPRVMVGLHYFYIGSIDSMCQALKIEDVEFAKIVTRLKDKLSLSQIYVGQILKNFYLENKRDRFSLEASIEGGKNFNAWYNSSFMSEKAIKSLSNLIDQWYENPDLSVEELSNLGLLDKSDQ